MAIDVTTVALAVDSTQVNSAAAALDKMATSGGKAETAATTLTKATTLQGKALTGLVAPADKAAASVADLADAGKGLKAGAFAEAAAGLGTTAVQAAKAQVAIAAVEVAQGKLARATQLAADAQAKLNALQLAPKSVAPQAIAAAQLRVTETQAGVGAATAGLASARAAAAAAQVVRGNEGIGKSARNAAFQQQQLAFQLNDFAVQVASGQSPLLALVQQGSQLSGTFGGIRPAIAAVTGLLTPLRVALGGAAAGAVALGVAFFEGQKQSKEFANAIQLTGNFAGQTEGKFNALTAAVAASTRETVGNVREFGQALISTGEIGPQVFAAATTAAVGYGNATGKTADEVAKDFAAMARAPAKFALEANRSLNFITAAQYASIKAFEENGRAADAQGVIYDALNARFPRIDQNLGTLEKALNIGKSAWSSFWNSAFDIGRADTIENKVARSASAVAAFRAPEVAENAGGAGFVGPNAGRRRNGAGQAAAQADLAGNLRAQFRQTENAFADAERAATEKRRISAVDYIKSLQDQAKGIDQLGEKLKEARAKFKEVEGTPLAVTPKEQARLEADIRRRFAAPKGAKGLKDNEPDQIRRANLDADLKDLRDQFQQERDALSFQNRFLQGEYQAGNVSLKQFYADKRATTAAAISAEIAELDKEKARIAQDRDATKDPSEKRQLQTKIDDTDRLQAKIRREAANDVALANQQEREAFKQLDEQIVAYRANLLQLSGDETGAARLRAQLAATQLSELAARTKGRPGEITEADQARSATTLADIDSVNQAKRQTSLINERLALEEERIAIAQRTGALSENAALQQQGEARAKLLPLLQKQADELQRLADANPLNLELQLDASRARLEIERLSAELDPLKDKFDNLFKGAANNTFNDILSGKLFQVDQGKLSQDLAEVERKYDASYARIAGLKSSNEQLKALAQNERERKAAQDRARKDAKPGAGAVLEKVGKSFLAPIVESFNRDTAKELSDAIFGKGGIFGNAGATLASGKQSAGGFGGQVAEFFGLKKPTDEKQQIADLFKEPAGNPASVTASFTTLQTTGIDPATAALGRLADAAEGASGAFARASGAAGVEGDAAGTFTPPGGFDFGGPNTTGEQSIADLFKAADQASVKTAAATTDFGAQATAAAQLVAQLGRAAGSGSSALSALPAAVQAFQAVINAFGGSGGGASSGDKAAGYVNLIGSLFGAFGGSGSSFSSFDTSGYNYTGDTSGTTFSQTGDMIRGRREMGGPVSADSLYRVNERGPEMLSVGGDDYLMMGAQAGKVTPSFKATFSAGGYTGNGGVKDAVGIVEGKEFVFSAPAVKRLGVAELDRMHKAAKSGSLPRYETGGYVGNAALMPAAGNQWLMAGTRGGSQDKAPEASGKTVNFTLNQSFAPGTSGQTTGQAAVQAKRMLARASRDE